jgi:hypothetical protein
MGVEEKRELIFKEEGQEYGQVLRLLGKLPAVIHTIIFGANHFMGIRKWKTRCLVLRWSQKNVHNQRQTEEQSVDQQCK